MTPSFIFFIAALLLEEGLVVTKDLKPGPSPATPVCCKTNAIWTVFGGPWTQSKTHANWLTDMETWRKVQVSKYNLTFSAYEDADVNWTRTSYVQPQVHLFDRYLYNDTLHEFTVARYLEDLTARYGGIDSVLIWPTYPNIGIDARNQFDLFRAMPGGMQALTDLTKQFHKAGVKVLWGYNPWDQNLRDEGEPHWTTMARLLKETGGDGFNGDTMNVMYKEFWQAGVDIGYKIVGEMEGGGYRYADGWSFDNSWASMEYNTMGWGYYDLAAGDGITKEYWYEPPVDKAKWLDSKGRRMTHVNDRWSTDRHTPMQFAHFNGVGYESWENVWGIFNHFTDRDGEALRRLQTMWRWLGVSQFTQNYKSWVPYAAEVAHEAGIFGSRWVHANGDCAWTVVNRDVGKRAFSIDLALAGCPGELFYDLYSGQPAFARQLTIEGSGYGAYVAVGGPRTGLEDLLLRMKHMTTKPLQAYSAEWEPLQQRMVSPGKSSAFNETPPGMILIPRTEYLFQTGGVEIEGGCDAEQDTFNTGNCCLPGQDIKCPGDEQCSNMCAFASVDNRGVDVQFPWERTPRRFHSQKLDIGPFFVDKHLVTNAQYAAYLNESGYMPRDLHNFAKDIHKPGSGDKPVTWVGLVWQYTDEFEDPHTRGAVLKGSSIFNPILSGDFPALPQPGNWYFPQAKKLTQHNRLLLMDDSFERAGTLGFRCVAEHWDGPPGPAHIHGITANGERQEVSLLSFYV